jgi:hypothetical protein
MANIINPIPSTFVYLNTPLTNVTGNATTYTIKFDTVSPGSGTGYDISTGLYTVSVPGKYLVVTCFQLNNIINGANGNLSGINVGSVYFRLTEFAMTAAKANTNTFTVNGLMTYDLNAGDTIFAVAQLNNGSVASVGISGGTAPYMSWLFIQYLS